MPIIRANAGIITQINVFTVPMGGQQALIDHLTEAARFSRDTPEVGYPPACTEATTECVW